MIAATSDNRRYPSQARLGSGLTVTVEELQPEMAKLPKGCNQLVLYLDGIALEEPTADACDPSTGWVHFMLERTEKSDKAWHFLLAEPVAFRKVVTVAVGPSSTQFYPTTANIELEVLPELEFYGYFVGLGLAALLAVALARRTALLRDRPDPGLPPGRLPPYSLARFQFAFWSFLVIAAYLFIWLITTELDTITGSVLALLGIGSGTALGSRLIDTNKPPAEAPAPVKGTISHGFLRDVLSDAQGISLYRFQLFVWTLVLGVIFVASVYNGLAMPQFNPTLLGLMGISSGTYLGFKVPEGRESPPPAPPPNAP